MTHLKAIVAAAALVFMLPATAQTLSQAIGNTNGTSAATPLEPAFQYHRLSFSYAPLFIGETVNGISFGYTYGANCSRTHPFFFEIGMNLNYNFKTFDGAFGYSMVTVDPNNLGDLDKLMNMDYDDFLNQDWDHTSDLKMKFNMLSWNIPVNFGYRYSINDNLSIDPYIGLNFKFNILAQADIESKANDNDYLNNAASDIINDMGSINFLNKDDMMGMQWKTFQMVWHIGAGVNYKRLNLGLRYGTDFIKIAEGTNSSNFYLSLGVNL